MQFKYLALPLVLALGACTGPEMTHAPDPPDEQADTSASPDIGWTIADGGGPAQELDVPATDGVLEALDAPGIDAVDLSDLPPADTVGPPDVSPEDTIIEDDVQEVDTQVSADTELDPEPDPEPEPEPDPEPYNLCGIGKDSPRAAGTWEEPIVSPFSPFVDKGDTAGSLSDTAQTYDCAPDTLEHGPEVVYRFTTEVAGDLRVELVDPTGVDIDLHLLQDPEIDDSGLVTGCLARAHETLLYEDLPAGSYWLVADTWTSASTGEEFQGTYDIAWEVISENTWSEVQLRAGVTWSRAKLSINGGPQTVSVLRMAPDSGWELQPHLHAGCKTAAQGMESAQAFAGVNANFYKSCAPTDLLKEDGVLHTTNQTTTYEQRTMGWNSSDDIQFAWLAPGVGWPEVQDAVGGYPSLITDGVDLAEAKPGSQVWSATDWAKHPRTLMGVDTDGHIVLATFDGRTEAGQGFTTPALSSWATDELNLDNAINLDGGGSTTMVVHDCWLNHTVSYPSDNDLADHEGLRAVASGLYLR